MPLGILFYVHKGIRTTATAKPVRMIQWIILKQRGLKGGGAAGGNPSSPVPKTANYRVCGFEF